MNSSHSSSIDLSIIILTYNTYDFTHACLRSALADGALTHYAVEIIVVDNGSTDNTVDRLRAEFPNIQTIENAANFGFARGNNIGLGAAHGRYLMLLNSDTKVQPGTLKSLIEFMDTHSNAGACGPMLLNNDGSLQPSGRSLPSLWSVFVGMTKLYRLWKRDFYIERGRDYTQIVRVDEVSGAAMLVRREVYERIGGLDENIFAYYEDVDWCKRIGDAGYAIYYVPTARVMHHWHGSTKSMSELAYRASQNSQRYYFRKYHSKLTNMLLQILLALKELAFIVVYTWRGDSNARRFHQRMLKNVLAPIASQGA